MEKINWLSDEMILKFMKEKSCKRDSAVRVLSIIPSEILPLSKHDMDRVQKVAQDYCDNPEKYNGE